MVEIETSVAHELGDSAALHRLHEMVDSLEDRYRDQVHQVHTEWNGNEVELSFAAYGYNIRWHATVLNDRIALVGRIPTAARAFRSKIEQAIVARVEEVFHSASEPTSLSRRAA